MKILAVCGLTCFLLISSVAGCLQNDDLKTKSADDSTIENNTTNITESNNQNLTGTANQTKPDPSNQNNTSERKLPIVIKYQFNGSIFFSLVATAPTDDFDDSEFLFKVEPNCTGIVAEQVWTPSQGSSGGLGLTLKAPDSEMWLTYGESPLKISLNASEIKQYEKGGDFSSITCTYLSMSSPSLETAVMQDFIIYISVFYGTEPDANYSNL